MREVKKKKMECTGLLGHWRQPMTLMRSYSLEDIFNIKGSYLQDNWVSEDNTNVVGGDNIKSD